MVGNRRARRRLDPRLTMAAASVRNGVQGVIDVEAAAADLCFAPDLAPYRISDFASASQIVAHAAAQLGPLLDAVSARYAALAARRAGQR